MIDRTELEARLKGWAQEYGGGKYENVGWHSRNLLQTLIEHKGFIPNGRGYVPVPIRSAADEVEQIVNEMESGGYYKQGRVVRCDYFLPNVPMDVRLRNLKHIGVDMSRASYFDHLAQAKALITGALRKAVIAA